MTNSSKKFVFLLTDFLFDELQVKKDDVGFCIEDRPDGKCLILHVRSGQNIQITRQGFKFFDVSKTGDLFDRKVCNVCHRLLPISEFAKNQNGKNNRTIRRPSCNECRKVMDGARASSKEIHEWLIKKPQLDLFQCPICQKVTIPGLTSKVVMDHDHKTGHIRGWICDSCNTGIGRFKDDTALLENAIKYLKANSH